MKVKSYSLFFIFVMLTAFLLPVTFTPVKAQATTKIGEYPYYTPTAYNPVYLPVKTPDGNKYVTIYAYATASDASTITIVAHDTNGISRLSGSLATNTYALAGIFMFGDPITDNSDAVFIVVERHQNGGTNHRWYFGLINFTSGTITSLGSYDYTSSATFTVSQSSIPTNLVGLGGYAYLIMASKQNKGGTTGMVPIIIRLSYSTIAGYSLTSVSQATSGDWCGAGYAFASPLTGTDIRSLFVYKDNNNVYLTALSFNVVTNTITVHGTQSLTSTYGTWVPTKMAIGGLTTVSLDKFRGLQYSYGSTYESFNGFLAMAHTTTYKTIMRMVTLRVYISPIFAVGVAWTDIYQISGYVSVRDTRDSMFTITDFYYYRAADNILYGVAYDATTGTATASVADLGITFTSYDNIFICGARAFWRAPSGANAIEIWLKPEGTAPMVNIVLPTPTTTLPPESESSFTSVATQQIVSLALPMLVLLLPCALLAFVMGGVGGAVGLAIGSAIATMGGLIPAWVLVIVAIGIAVLALHKIGVLRLGGSGDESD